MGISWWWISKSRFEKFNTMRWAIRSHFGNKSFSYGFTYDRLELISLAFGSPYNSFNKCLFLDSIESSQWSEGCPNTACTLRTGKSVAKRRLSHVLKWPKPAWIECWSCETPTLHTDTCASTWTPVAAQGSPTTSKSSRTAVTTTCKPANSQRVRSTRRQGLCRPSHARHDRRSDDWLQRRND